MTKQMKLYEVLKRASLFLEKHGCEQHIGEILLQHYMQLSRSEFYAKMHDPIQPSIIERLFADLQKHVDTGVPVQHLTNEEHFYGRKFFVNEHVLIPRPETEELVKYIIDITEEKFPHEPVKIVDIGTGSGVIAITLALQLSQATVYATDICEQALQVAKQNAAHFNAPVTFLSGNFAQPLIDRQLSIDIIVSNPPYIARREASSLSRTVKNFDPALALFADDEGTAAYQTIVQQSKRLLKSPHMIAFEIGYQQGDAVQSIIKKGYPKSDVHVLKDINGKDRIVIAYIKET